MRLALIVAGLLLVAVGIGGLMGKLDYRKTDTLVQVGDAKLEANHEKAVPQWAGIAALVVGGGLLLAGVARKT